MKRGETSDMRNPFFVGTSVCAVVLSATLVWADQNFAPPKLTDFTVQTWGSLEFGRTTQEGIKKAYKNTRGDFRNSVELKMSPAQPYKVFALFPNVKKEATLDSVVLCFKNETDGPSLDSLKTALGTDLKRTYPPTRHDDWSIAIWPNRGIAALLLREQAVWVLLGDPARVSRIGAGFADTAPTVTDVPDPSAGKKKEIVFGSVSADFSLTRMDVNKNRERDNIEREVQRPLTSDSVLRYDSGSDGTYRVSVSATNHDDKDGSGSVSASLEGVSPYGKISVSEYESFTVRKQTRRLEDTNYFRTLERVERTLADKARKALDKQGPPKPEDVRHAAWEQLVEDYRQGKSGSSGGLL